MPSNFHPKINNPYPESSSCFAPLLLIERLHKNLMAKKSLQISSLNILEANSYVLAPVTTLSLTLNGSSSFQPLCVTRLASQALLGYVYTAFHRQIGTCSPYSASWLGESQMQTGCCVDLGRTLLSLNWWASMRAAAWPHASWFTLSSPLSVSQHRRNKCVSASKILHACSLGRPSESHSTPLCAPPQSCWSDFISSEQGLSPVYASTSSVLSADVPGCIQNDKGASFCHPPSLGSMWMTHNL